MRALTKTLALLSSTLNRLALTGAMLALGVMVCVVGFQVVARHAMIWAGLLEASLRAAGVLLFIAPVLYFSLFGPTQNPMRGFIMRSLDKTTEVTGISMLFITAAIPLVFTLILIHLLADLSVRFTADQT